MYKMYYPARVCAFSPFSFEGGVWDFIGLVPFIPFILILKYSVLYKLDSSFILSQFDNKNCKYWSIHFMRNRGIV